MTGVPLTIEESARAVGAWAWAESSFFGVVGTWVASTDSPSAKLYFDACSQHHAWRAQLWRSLLPPDGAPFYPVAADHDASRPPGLQGPSASTDASSSGSPLSPWSTAMMKALSELDGGAERTAAYSRVVLPRMVTAYRSWQAMCVPSSDRPVARVLGLALSDVLNDWERGVAVLLGYMEGPGAEEAVDGAARASAQVEQLLAGLGPVPGTSAPG
jgi:hypothetical protein